MYGPACPLAASPTVGAARRALSRWAQRPGLRRAPRRSASYERLRLLGVVGLRELAVR